MNSRKLKGILPRGTRRKIGAALRWLRAQPARTRRQKEKMLASNSLSSPERALLAKVDSRVSCEDGMYKGDGEHYFKVGLSAIRCIDEALHAAQIESVREVLDMPCGYGRVLRFLVHRFPQARVTACELLPDAVRFCAEELGATPAYSSYDLDDLFLQAQFDVIWCGSLVTHLDGRRIGDLLRFFARHLVNNGLLIFTTHGDFVADRIIDVHESYGLNRSDIPALVESYRQIGQGYLDYPGAPGYGVSLTSPEWVRDQTRLTGELREVYFKARGWDAHQDVFGFVKK